MKIRILENRRIRNFVIILLLSGSLRTGLSDSVSKLGFSDNQAPGVEVGGNSRSASDAKNDLKASNLLSILD